MTISCACEDLFISTKSRSCHTLPHNSASNICLFINPLWYYALGFYYLSPSYCITINYCILFFPNSLLILSLLLPSHCIGINPHFLLSHSSVLTYPCSLLVPLFLFSRSYSPCTLRICPLHLFFSSWRSHEFSSSAIHISLPYFRFLQC